MEDNMEIDVFKLLLSLKRRLPAIAVAAVAGALIMFVVTYFFSVPMYRAEAKVYISNKVAYDSSSQSVDIVDINASIQLVPVFSQLIGTETVLDKVAAASQLPYTARQIADLVHTEQIEDTAVLKVSVVSPNPEHSAVLANTFATTGITEITKVAPGSSAYLIDEAEAPALPYSPSLPKRVLIGFFAGALIVAAVVVIKELFDTKVRTEEDLAGVIGAPVLGVVGRQKLPTA